MHFEARMGFCCLAVRSFEHVALEYTDFWLCCSSDFQYDIMPSKLIFSELHPLSTCSRRTDDVTVICCAPHILTYSLQSLWIERTTLTLTHSLPGISRWFEVERRELVTSTVPVIGVWNDELLMTWDRELKTPLAEVLQFKMMKFTIA